MLATALALVLLPEGVVPAPYPQFPSAAACAALRDVAQADLDALDARLAVCGAWERRGLSPLRGQAARLLEVWEAAVGVTQNDECVMYPGEDGYPKARCEWAQELYEMVGRDDFYAGRLPWPLSLR